MCCNKRKERRSQAAVAAAIVGATYQQYNNHQQQQQMAMGDPSRNYPAPTLLDPKTSPNTHQAPSTHTSNTSNATPPSYESVMNDTSLPAGIDTQSTRTAKPIIPHHINDTENFPSHDAVVGVPAGITWWQAYKARKSERREAWRAEKAEWRAEKAEWRALRRAGRC